MAGLPDRFRSTLDEIVQIVAAGIEKSPIDKGAFRKAGETFAMRLVRLAPEELEINREIALSLLPYRGDACDLFNAIENNRGNPAWTTTVGGELDTWRSGWLAKLREWRSKSDTESDKAKQKNPRVASPESIRCHADFVEAKKEEKSIRQGDFIDDWVRQHGGSPETILRDFSVLNKTLKRKRNRTIR